MVGSSLFLENKIVCSKKKKEKNWVYFKTRYGETFLMGTKKGRLLMLSGLLQATRDCVFKQSCVRFWASFFSELEALLTQKNGKVLINGFTKE